MKVKRLEDLKEGCVLTFGDSQYEWSPEDQFWHMKGRPTLGKSFASDEMQFFLDHGAVEMPDEPLVWEVDVEALAQLYLDYPVAIATLCDEYLDRSGALLGRVRIEEIREP